MIAIDNFEVSYLAVFLSNLSWCLVGSFCFFVNLLFVFPFPLLTILLSFENCLTTCFDHLHSLSPILCRYCMLLYPSKLMYTEFYTNLCCLRIFWGMTFHCIMINAPGPVLLEKTDSPSFRNKQLPIAPLLGVGICAQLPVPCWDVVWHGSAQVLCMLSQPLWVHMCRCLAVSRRYCFLRVTHFSWLLYSFYTLLCNNYP